MDARRRRLERELEQGADARAARAALLRERVRAGELSRERVVLAAHLGDETAGDALGQPAPPDGDAWFRALGAISEEVALRAVLAVVPLAEPFRRALAGPTARAAHGVLPGCAWAAASCQAPHEPANLDRARDLARHQRTFADRYGQGSEIDWRVSWSPACSCACAGLSGVAAPGLVGRLSAPWAVAWLAETQVGADRVRAVLEQTLLPWALGQADDA